MDVAVALQAICVHHLAHADDSYFNTLHCKKKIIWAEFFPLAFLVQQHQYLFTISISVNLLLVLQIFMVMFYNFSGGKFS
jgi:hypothetical protein